MIYELDGENMDIEEMWNILLDMGVCEQTLVYVTNINGYSIETLQDILYVKSGYRTFEQLFEE